MWGEESIGVSSQFPGIKLSHRMMMTEKRQKSFPAYRKTLQPDHDLLFCPFILSGPRNVLP